MIESIVAGSVTLASSPFIARLLVSWGLIDTPNHRSLHSSPVPRGGGIACSLGVLAGGATAAIRGAPLPWFAVLVPLSLALVGLFDDRRSLPPAGRLAAQAVGGVLLGLAMGAGWWLLLGLVIVPITVNTVNFMDGVNGMTAANLASWGLVSALVSRGWDDDVVSVLGAVVAATALGFLPWNSPRARLFLGDSGSYLFGSLVSVGLILGMLQAPRGLILLAPLSIYFADTGATLIIRLFRREPILQAHREHTYQRIAAQGWSHTAVSALVLVCNLVITLAWLPGRPVLGVPASVIIVSAYLLSPIPLRRLRAEALRRRTNGAAHDT